MAVIKHNNLQKDSPLPWRVVILLSITHLGQAVQLSMLHPILVFLVTSYNVTDDEKEIGSYVGFLAGLYPFGHFCSSFVWGIISDATGRKIWMIFGNVVTGVSAVLLGFCQDYWLACVVRLAGGVLNCTLLISKSILAESCNQTNISKGYAVLNVSWGVGAIVGSLSGGLLSNPCRLYTKGDCPVYLKEYPYLLPLTVSALMSVIGTICSCLLPETNPAVKMGYSQLGTSDNLELDEMNDYKSIGKGYTEFPVVEKQWEEEGVGKVQIIRSLHSLEEAEEEEEERREGRAFFSRPKPFFMFGDGKKMETIWRILRNQEVQMVTVLYALFGFSFSYSEELFPIFAAGPKALGGLGMKASSLGYFFGIGGGVTILYSLFLYPYVVERLKVLKCVQLAVFTMGFTFIVMPFCSLLVHFPTLEWILLLLLLIVKVVILSTVFPSIMVLGCNAASSETLATVQGLGQSFSFFCRGFAPAVGGLIWSISTRFPFPLHPFFPWICVACTTFVTYYYSSQLSTSLNYPRISPL